MKKKLHLIQPHFLFGISGFLFWFLIGFPFNHRNESYEWIVYLDSWGIQDILFKKFPVILTYRPLTQLIVYIIYNLSDYYLGIVQILNFSILIYSLLLLYIKSYDKKTFSFLLFFLGAFFFNGFYYVFHLHGFFYSPIMLFITLLFFFKKKELSHRKLMILSISSFMMGFLHPYSIVIFISFLIGYIFEVKLWKTKKRFIIYLAILTISFLQLIFIAPSSQVLVPSYLFNNLIITLSNLELNGILSIFVLILSIYLLYIANISNSFLFYLGVIILHILFVIFSFPTIIILIVLLLYISTTKMNWSFFLIVLAAVFFPAVVSSGSPIKAFLIPLCIILFFTDQKKGAVNLKFLNKKAFFSVMFCFIITIASIIRAGVQFPIISKFINPIIIEREKTQQLENIIEWKQKSNFKTSRLIFTQSVLDIRKDKTNMLKRETIPPTMQNYLDVYLDYVHFNLNTHNDDRQLYISFGTKSKNDPCIIYSVKSYFAGTATLSLCKK